MSTLFSLLALVMSMVVLGSGCTAIKGIFEAGFWVGALVVLVGLAVVAGIVWLISKVVQR